MENTRYYGENAVGVPNKDIVGFTVEAVDGSIGKIDQSTDDAGPAYIVVDTGPWIFGKKVMLPVGVIRRIHGDSEIVEVNRTMDQIKNAPEFDESLTRDVDYRARLGAYYGRGGSGYQDD